ncbi:beta-lactamase-like protein [Crassisporium funariophilum]|nr:beta-lactamase-like protein [Crassisporium funariophilum]
MSQITVTFLGTSSGGGPTESRNCSSLVCDMLADQSLWNCAEGTVRQFQHLPSSHRPHLRISRIRKIFITHMHADHVMGIVPLLRNILFPPRAADSPYNLTASSGPTIELYGPAGLRLFIRQIMKMTLTGTADKYVVHELLTETDSVTPCDDATDVPNALSISLPNVMHSSETVGLDIRASPEDGLWRAVTQGTGRMSEIVVDAGPIHHRDPCLGYVFFEAQYPFRKLVLLGDTSDPSPIIPLCINPPPSLLVHEATDSCISRHADPSGKLSRRTVPEVTEKTLSRGHSIPQMAGAFAKLVGAKQLVLNHIGGRFGAPRNAHDFRHKIMADIENKASLAWGPGKHAVAAYDYLAVTVPVDAEYAATEETMPGSQTGEAMDYTDSRTVPDAPQGGKRERGPRHAHHSEGSSFSDNRKRRR